MKRKWLTKPISLRTGTNVETGSLSQPYNMAVATAVKTGDAAAWLDKISKDELAFLLRTKIIPTYSIWLEDRVRLGLS